MSNLFPDFPRRPVWILAGLVSFLLLPVMVRAEGVEFPLPGSPLPWLLVEVLGVFFIFGLGAFLYLVRIILGDKRVRLPSEVKQALEKSYVEKQREEFKKKAEVINEKIRELRRHLSEVFMKVKNLSTTLDPAKVFEAIVGMLETEIGADKYILFLHDRDKQELFPYRWKGYSDAIRDKVLVPLDHPHFLTFAFQRRRHVYRLAATEDTETRPLIDRPPVSTTLLALPIANPVEAFGVIHIESFKDGRQEIDEADLRFYASLSSFMGMALANANVFLQTRDELTSTKQLSEQELIEKKRLKEIFSRYTSSELVDSLLKNPGSVNLGGTTKVASILFSDIAGFTKFSSRLPPDQVVSTMNEYLSRMAEVVLDNNGEIDKFIGDAVMARFGVLVDLPAPGLSAVRSALAMLDELHRLQAVWSQQNREGFNIRIGIATGPVLAGNIGSERRQEFTVMGTTVNLASRLEALNKDLGTTILVDDATYQQISHEIRALPRENVEIRGLEGTIRVYEVQGLREEGAVRSKIIHIKDKMPQNRPEPSPEPAQPTGDPGLPDSLGEVVPPRKE